LDNTFTEKEGTLLCSQHHASEVYVDPNCTPFLEYNFKHFFENNDLFV